MGLPIRRTGHRHPRVPMFQLRNGPRCPPGLDQRCQPLERRALFLREINPLLRSPQAAPSPARTEAPAQSVAVTPMPRASGPATTRAAVAAALRARRALTTPAIQLAGQVSVPMVYEPFAVPKS